MKILVIGKNYEYDLFKDITTSNLGKKVYLTKLKERTKENLIIKRLQDSRIRLRRETLVVKISLLSLSSSLVYEWL